VKLRKDLIIGIAGLLLTANPCAAQQPPPEPTSGFCVNVVTGAMRVQLSNDAGFVKPCRINELEITLESIAQLPVETPNAKLFKVVTQLPLTAVKDQASTTPPMVIDATGKPLGNLIGFDYVGNAYVEMNLNTSDGGLLEVPVTSQGFTQAVPDNNRFVDYDYNLTTFFTATDCDSTALFSIYKSASGIQTAETGFGTLVDSDDAFTPQTTAVIGNTLYYGTSPTTLPTITSAMGFLNPSNLTQITSKDGTCFQIQLVNLGGTLAGTPASVNLSAFTPPFSIQQ
jgi:hypothetical protein